MAAALMQIFIFPNGGIMECATSKEKCFFKVYFSIVVVDMVMTGAKS